MGIFKNDKAKATASSAGSSGAAADSAVEGRPHGDQGSDGPHSRPIEPLGENEKHDQLAEKGKECRGSAGSPAGRRSGRLPQR